MSAPSAYIDSSVIVAFMFEQVNHQALYAQLENYSKLISTELTEAEVLSAATREKVSFVDAESFFESLSFFRPTRSLRPELKKVLTHGYVRGADAFHLASALFIDPEAENLHFATLDIRQAKVATALGFNLLDGTS